MHFLLGKCRKLPAGSVTNGTLGKHSNDHGLRKGEQTWFKKASFQRTDRVVQSWPQLGCSFQLEAGQLSEKTIIKHETSQAQMFIGRKKEKEEGLPEISNQNLHNKMHQHNKTRHKSSYQGWMRQPSKSRQKSQRQPPLPLLGVPQEHQAIQP